MFGNAPAADAARRDLVDGELKGAEAEFLRDAEGNLSWFRVGGRIMSRVD